MKLVCSYCRASLGEREPLDDPRLSHGMCPQCADYFGRQWRGLRLGEFLDQFDVPVLAVDGDVRVIAANESAADRLGTTSRELAGLLGGEVMECEHARSPDGCGRTIHCRDCVIRTTVAATIAHGEPKGPRRAGLLNDDRMVHFVISTSLQGDVVLLRIEDLKESA